VGSADRAATLPFVICGCSRSYRVIDPHVLYSPKGANVTTRAPRDLIYHDLHSGKLKAIRRGNRWLIPGVQLRAWLEEMAEERD
jgi:excisionase family DNA binding protein